MTSSSHKAPVALLLIVSALVITAMLPLTNQIFSDDVAFSQSVRHFLQTGDLKVSEYTAASSISHILWGSIFAKVLGFSFSSLNLSVIALLPVLLIGIYKILRSLEVSETRSLIFTLFFLAIPWIPFLSFTFMSDIPFLTLEILTILCFLIFKKTLKIKYLSLSLIFASLAFLTRQLGLALILGVVSASFLQAWPSAKKVKTLALPFAIPTLTLILYYIWLSIPGNKTIPQYVYEAQTVEAVKKLFQQDNLLLLMHRTFNYANQAMGLMFPLVLVFTISNIKGLSSIIKKNPRPILISVAIAGILYLVDVTNFRENYTVGFPIMVYEYESFLPIPWPYIWKYLVMLSIPFWSSLIAISVLKGIKKPKVINIYLLTTFCPLFFMTLVTYQSWDRYVIPFLPFAFIFLAKSTLDFKIRESIALTVVTIMILDAVQMTKLRLTETGLLYKIGNQLVSTGVEPSTIDLNRDQNWDIWFYFEEGIQKQIAQVNGDKTKIENFQLFPLPKKEIKYTIYTDRTIKYQNLNIDYSKAIIIPFKSMFVSSQLTFVNY